jgi:hypothetical protein
MFRIPTVYTKFDKALNQTVEYRYAVQEIPIKTGKDEGMKKYLPDRVVFSQTSLVVTPDKPDLYEFLIQSPWYEKAGNENIFRQAYKPLFYSLNPVETAQTRLQRIAKREQAISMIVGDKLPEITLRRILTSISGDGDSHDIEVVKEKLVDHAEKDPKGFLAMIGSKDTELKAIIAELRDKEFIKYESSVSQWQWGRNTKEAGNKIVAIPTGKNEIDWMIDTLLREEELLKSFKILSKTPDAPKVSSNKSDERSSLEDKARKLKISQGMVHMKDENLKIKIEKEVKKLKAELSKEDIADTRKSAIETLLESVGELQTV